MHADGRRCTRIGHGPTHQYCSSGVGRPGSTVQHHAGLRPIRVFCVHLLCICVRTLAWLPAAPFRHGNSRRLVGARGALPQAGREMPTLRHLVCRARRVQEESLSASNGRMTGATRLRARHRGRVWPRQGPMPPQRPAPHVSRAKLPFAGRRRPVSVRFLSAAAWRASRPNGRKHEHGTTGPNPSPPLRQRHGHAGADRRLGRV